MNTYKI